jgi:hypothetical protein
MPTFIPPINPTEVPALEADTRGPMRRLLRYHGGNPRGRNVYILSDNTVTETDPDSVTVFWTDQGDGSVYVKRVFFGAVQDAYNVSEAEKQLLEAAGYTVT